MNKKQKIIISVFIFIVLGIVFGFIYANRTEDIRQSQSIIAGAETDDFEEFRGKNYNTDLQTVVFLGIDNNQEVEERSYGYAGQSDAIFVYVMNTKTNQARLLQLSRDTMVDLDLYDINGEFYTSSKGQLALQYAYGDGREQSCIITSEKISQILNNIPIQAYVSFDMGGISQVSEAFGGIDLVLDEDFTDIDSSFVKGEKVHLEGDILETFIRRRDLDATGSNEARMNHHREILEAFLKKDIDNPSKVLEAANPYMVSNLKLSEIEHLLDSNIDEDVIVVPGKMVSGQKHDEFYMDEEELEKIILDLFYQ